MKMCDFVENDSVDEAVFWCNAVTFPPRFSIVFVHAVLHLISDPHRDKLLLLLHLSIKLITSFLLAHR